MDVTVNDNTQMVIDELRQGYERALLRIGLAAEGYAKKKCPVDTGLLRNSITFAVSGGYAQAQIYKNDKGESGAYTGTAPANGEDEPKSVYIGTNVEYAPDVELGTSHSKAYPFLKPAATGHTTVYRRILEDELKNG